MIIPKIKVINKATGKKAGGTYSKEEIKKATDTSTLSDELKSVESSNLNLGTPPAEHDRIGVRGGVSIGAVEKSVTEGLQKFLHEINNFERDVDPKNLAEAYKTVKGLLVEEAKSKSLIKKDMPDSKWSLESLIEEWGDTTESFNRMKGFAKDPIDRFKTLLIPKEHRKEILKQAKSIFQNSPKKLALVTALFGAMDEENADALPTKAIIEVINKITGKKAGGTYSKDEIEKVIGFGEPKRFGDIGRANAMGESEFAGRPSLGVQEKSHSAQLFEFVRDMDADAITPEGIAKSYKLFKKASDLGEEMKADHFYRFGVDDPDLAGSGHKLAGWTGLEEEVHQMLAHLQSFPKEQRKAILLKAKELYKNSPKKLALVTALFTAMNEEDASASIEEDLKALQEASIPSENPESGQQVPSMEEEYEKNINQDNLLQLDLGMKEDGEAYDFISEIHPSFTTPEGETPVMTKNNGITLNKLLETGKELGADAFEIIGGAAEDGVKNSLKLVRDTLREHGQAKIGSMSINELMDLWNEHSMFRNIDLDERVIKHTGQPLKEILRGLTSVFGGMGAIKLVSGASALLSAVGSEFLVFDPKDGNLATLLRQWDVPPEFMKEIAKYMDSSEAETSAGGRMLNVLEGFLFGLGIQSITKKGRQELKDIPKDVQDKVKTISESAYDKLKTIKGLWGKNNSFDDYLNKNRVYEKKIELDPSPEVKKVVKKQANK